MTDGLEDRGGSRTVGDRRKKRKPISIKDRRSGRDRRSGYDRRRKPGRRRSSSSGTPIERRDVFRKH